MKEKVTKKGDRMAFVTLEDLYGFVEVIVFADVYKEASSLLNSEKPILVKGEIDRNETSSKLIAKDIIDLAMAEEEEVDLVEFCITKDDDTENKLIRLKEIIIEHPGNCKASLLLNVEGKGEAVIMMSDKYNVKPSNFLKGAVKNIFGYDVIKLKVLKNNYKNNIGAAV